MIFSRSTQDFQSTTTLKTWSLVALDRGSLYRGKMNGKTQGRNKLGRITQEVVMEGVAKASLTVLTYQFKFRIRNLDITNIFLIKHGEFVIYK